MTKILEIKGQQSEAEASALADATFNYYKTGVLPTGVAKSECVALPWPKLIVNFTVADRLTGKQLKLGQS